MIRNPSRVFLVVTVAAILQGCRDALRPVGPHAAMTIASATEPLVPRVIAPQATDPDIDWIPSVNPLFNHHAWLDLSRPSNGKLFVFLPGIGPTPPRPGAYQLVQQEAARLGYHVIGLMYQNNVGPSVCIGGSDSHCFENVRLEMIDGVDHSAFLNVDRANGIDNRLTKLLLYLDAQFPSEGWSQFVHNGAPKWSKIAVGGHSGGAGQAALIGKIRYVDRVVMIAGPAPDAESSGDAAAWAFIGETPAAKYFELFHVRDHFSPAIVPNVAALNLDRFGEPAKMEIAEPPYRGTHILVTDLEPRGGYAIPNPHLSTAVDAWTPLGSDGTALLRDAWRYMLGKRGAQADDDQRD